MCFIESGNKSGIFAFNRTHTAKELNELLGRSCITCTFQEKKDYSAIVLNTCTVSTLIQESIIVRVDDFSIKHTILEFRSSGNIRHVFDADSCIQKSLLERYRNDCFATLYKKMPSDILRNIINILANDIDLSIPITISKFKTMRHNDTWNYIICRLICIGICKFKSTINSDIYNKQCTFKQKRLNHRKLFKIATYETVIKESPYGLRC